METKFNFKSQICTTREQSERLLALGVKPETADMLYKAYMDEDGEIQYRSDVIERNIALEGTFDFPAWSLHRLIELAYGNWKEDIVPIYLGNSYDMLIGRIEFQVKQGKFNKEYLV